MIKWKRKKPTQEQLAKLAQESITGKGARNLTSSLVFDLCEYWHPKKYILHIVEAHSIERQFDVPKFEYSISGPLPRTGNGMQSDQEKCRNYFKKLDVEANEDNLVMRYTVWFTEYEQYLDSAILE